VAAQEVAATDLALEGVRKSFGSVAALDGVELALEPGEFLTILGPSGSGKTTLLKVVAGFELPEAGRVLVGGEDVTLAPPAKRNLGMVFQHYALFPHMTARENVAFPLEMRRLPRGEIARRTAEALALVDLAGLEGRLPRQLSGGQQQRVALARALVFNPRLLLLDEPFGALDRKLRDAMQLEVRRLQKRLAVTTLFITHDQDEALVLSDRVAVMSRGRIEQVGRPREIYERPANAFVADFVGESNLLFGTVTGTGEGRLELALADGLRLLAAGEATRGTRLGALVRPEHVLFASGAATANRFDGEVLETVYTGTAQKYRVRLANGTVLLARVPSAMAVGSIYAGERVHLAIAPERVHLFPEG